MIRRITEEEYKEGFKLTRTIYASGKVLYKANFKQYEDILSLNLDMAEDLEFLDDFAYEELYKSVKNKMRK